MPEWCSVDAGRGQKPRNWRVRERGTAFCVGVWAIEEREKVDALLFSRLERKRVRQGAAAGGVIFNYSRLGGVVWWCGVVRGRGWSSLFAQGIVVDSESCKYRSLKFSCD